MGSHRRKWGWWLVAAIAVAVAASLFLHRNPAGSSAPAASSAGAVEAESSGPVVRDTVYVTVGDETVPIVRERKVQAKESRKDVPAAGESAGSDASVVADAPADSDTPAASDLSAASDAPAAALETVVAVPVKLLNELVRDKSGRDVTLSASAPDKITVAYAGKVGLPMVGEQNMNFSVDFKVVEVTGDRLVLQLDSGAAMNLAADAVAPYVLKRLPAGLVDSFSGGRAVINLSAIPQLKKQLRSVDIVGFSIDADEIRLRTVEK